MDEDFQTTCEDGSPGELGELFCTMWRNCGAGDFTIVNNAMASERVRNDTIARSMGLDSGTGDAIDSDDECEDGMDMEEAAEAMEAVPEEPLVDEDGFMMAGKGKKKGALGGRKA